MALRRLSGLYISFAKKLNSTSTWINRLENPGHLLSETKLCVTGGSPLWSCTRSLSRFGAPHHSTRYTTRQEYSEEEDEDEYDVNEEDLKQLRKDHRNVASHQHVGKAGVVFRDFPLHASLLAKLEELGYNQPFDIQQQTLTHTLAGKDVIGKALTGSGKTLAFTIPIVQKLSHSQRTNKRSPRAIVISPTRELCLQIHRSIEELAPQLQCVAVYGGDPIIKQERELRRGVDVVCATPGRLRDHLERGNFNLEDLSFLCLDEADELLTPNFKEQIEDVLENSPKDKQMMLFSATMPPNIRAITHRYMNHPAHVDIASQQTYAAPTSVKHLCMRVSPYQQLAVVQSLVKEHNPERCIVFMETKDKVREAAFVLKKELGLSAEGISSDLTQRRREIIMAAFRKGYVKVLVATDVAARGLDIPEVDLVVQVGPPKNGTQYYIHRSGRTGRAGREGLAVMLHSGNSADREIVSEIQRLVPLQHVEPPNMLKMQVDSARKLVESLQKMDSKTVANYLPAVEGIDMSGTTGQHLLAAALARIVKKKKVPTATLR